jgi:D-alanyl-D-alanine carboxypeptidase/D-alanyl-D-alanine-endopeptidase (penicillin-binding protein 4)
LGRHLGHSVVLLWWGLFATVAFAQAGRTGELPEATVRALRDAEIAIDEAGVFAAHLDDGSVIVSRNADRPLQPASTIKTLTAIVALEQLGPGWRTRTSALATAGIRHGRLDGDLFLRGGGSVDFDAAALRRMLVELRLSGVRRITGDVVLDRTLFDPARPDIGVPPFDETPEFRYNVIPDALLLNSNLVRLDLDADDRGVRVAMTPHLDRVDVSATKLALVERECDKWEDGWRLPVVEYRPRGGLRIELRGEFPADCRTHTEVNVLERLTFATRLFRAEWRALGGRLDGIVREGATPRGARVLAEHSSRTLLEWTRDILKRSDNPITRQTYLLLGTEASDPDRRIPRWRRSMLDAGSVASPPAPSGAGREKTLAASERVVRGWLRAHALDDAGLVLENGSGLSRRERISPRLLAGVIAAAMRSPFAAEFQAMLPIVGVDAAMARRLPESPAVLSGRFKTGSLRNVVSVAGFVPDAAGRICVVVAIVNHDRPFDQWSAKGRAALDSVIDFVARSGKP